MGVKKMAQQDEKNDDNIVACAQKNGLTLKRELFARHVASGKSQSEAARLAGYRESDVEAPTIPSRLMRNGKVQARIQTLINERDYEALAHSHWQEVLSANVPDFSDDPKMILVAEKIWAAKDRVIATIARLGGWEPAKQEESKKLIVHSDLRAMLPASKS